jgi:hypothetical protein
MCATHRHQRHVHHSVRHHSHHRSHRNPCGIGRIEQILQGQVSMALRARRASPQPVIKINVLPTGIEKFEI